ncbi:TWiK family of potassium channels protein [Apis cerana cerana]|uniref:TWiK family of potassium channels protein n=1 Tax=Apis cerana cerana TaxID=94128 RepID=A0A2A3ELZ9_APICC|nr:TWiK family of potassium channels protein [Apis cerana cerana]
MSLVVFRYIELPAELSRLEALRANLRVHRYSFVDSVSNNSDVSNLRKLFLNNYKECDDKECLQVSVKLREYEQVVQEAAQSGLLITFVSDTIDQENRDTTDLPPIVIERWSILQAVFFASTVLTTIGYGNVVPSTNGGRMFCILFAFVGIPLTLIVIADLGKLFARGVVKIALAMKSKLPLYFSFSCIPTNLAGRRSLGAFTAIVLLFLYLACGAGMFMLWEDDWNFFDGFYFCFVTMTTIGFGDLVPKKPKYTLLCTLYILIGLALTSTIIELVRRQYAQSWRRLQRLSGPLAETIRRLGEQAGGDMSALHSDLRKVLTVISMPRLKWSTSLNRGDTKEQDWEEAVEAMLRDIAVNANNIQPKKKQIMQIVIYESNKPLSPSSISSPNVGLAKSTKTIICRRALWSRSCKIETSAHRQLCALRIMCVFELIIYKKIQSQWCSYLTVLYKKALVMYIHAQLSIMTGIKDPTKQPDLEKIKQENEQMNVLVRRSFMDIKNMYMQHFFKFSKDMAESFRSILDDIKVRIEEFHEQNQSIFDLFSLSQLQKWSQSQREQ